MIRVLTSQSEHISFMKSLPITEGEVVCAPFLPKPLFPKDVIQKLYTPSDRPRDVGIVHQVWSFGRSIRRAVREGLITILVDFPSLKIFCEKGVMRGAGSGFVATYPVRSVMLRDIMEFHNNGRLVVVPSPIPYAFRLHPPGGVLLDFQNFQRTSAEQKIHGIWLEGDHAFSAFNQEIERLRSAVGGVEEKTILVERMVEALSYLERGEHYEWEK